MNATNHLSELKLEIISRCPLKCLHCSSESSQDCADQMDLSHIRRLTSEFTALGCTQVHVSGGEPLEHPDLLEILCTLHDGNAAVSLYTTGIRTGAGRQTIVPDEAKRLRSYLRSAIFSLYGGTAEVHDSVTGVPGSFEATLESLEVCRDAGLDVAVHFVPMQTNYQSLPSLVRMAQNLGAHRVSLLRFVPHGRGAEGQDSLALTQLQLLDLGEIVRSLIVDTSAYLRLGSPFRILHIGDAQPCLAGIDRMLVTPGGAAYPCDAFKDLLPDNTHHNVFTDGLAKVWRHSAFFRRVRSMASMLPLECRNCQHEHSCRGGCLAQRAFAYGLNGTQRDPLCCECCKHDSAP